MDLPLKNKVAVITGANQGFGFEIAREYVRAGASVSLCARNESLLLKASGELRKSASGDQRIISFATDVTRETDVFNFVDQTITEFGHIDILVNNAGIYGPKGPVESVEWSDWVQAVEINLFGSLLMCRAVLPAFKRQGYGKIIQISGGGATHPMQNFSAYSASKAAIVRFAETLAVEVADFNIDVNSLAPGALNTRMLDEVLEAGREKVGDMFFEKAVKQKLSGGVEFKKGTDLAVFLASDASNGITGKLINAVWDNWKEWPAHLDVLRKSDLYTIRRIIGKDRDFSAGDN